MPKAIAHPHLAPRAKNVIMLFMSGGPSQVDTFDPKPLLKRLQGEDVPESIARTVPKIRRAGLRNVMASPWTFTRYGQSGLPVSSLFPHVAQVVDDLCVIRSMHHRNPVHGPAECLALTGSAVGHRPSLGAWSIYGLGSLNENLPAFVAMNLHTHEMIEAQDAGWGAGFLPAHFQATVVDAMQGVRYTTPAHPRPEQQRQLEMLDWLNRRHLGVVGEHSELDARRKSYELAFRMQSAAPELFFLFGETAATHRLYGLERPESAQTGRALLVARRMVERGVRFVQVRVGDWDAHDDLPGNHRRMAARTDLPVAGLLRDLKQRGLLHETLVVWAGEFGRTPTMEGQGSGRDHSPAGYTVWLAGGGVRGGQSIGATDEMGYVAVERPITPHDLHATILHATGIDASRLTYLHHGRHEIPTVEGGSVISEVFEG